MQFFFTLSLRALRTGLLCLLVLFALPHPGHGDAADGTRLADAREILSRQDEDSLWRELDPGLDYAELASDGLHLVALRIDPTRYEFVLCSSARDGTPPATLGEWGEKYQLSAAINASMYLPDGRTSTGYLRDGNYINNGRIVQRFGAFLVANPDDPDLPRATIIEKDDDIWKELLPHYGLVVQNYRIINSQRRILWSPGGPLYSISAIAMDGDGNILFLHSRNPMETYTFAQQLLHLPFNIRTVLYVEGGGQAGLLIRSGSLNRELQGRRAVDIFVTGNRTVRLPNIIGVRPIRDSSEIRYPVISKNLEQKQ